MGAGDFESLQEPVRFGFGSKQQSRIVWLFIIEQRVNSQVKVTRSWSFPVESAFGSLSIGEDPGGQLSCHDLGDTARLLSGKG